LALFALHVGRAVRDLRSGRVVRIKLAGTAYAGRWCAWRRHPVAALINRFLACPVFKDGVTLGAQRTAKDLELQAARQLLDNLTKINHRPYVSFS